MSVEMILASMRQAEQLEAEAVMEEVEAVHELARRLVPLLETVAEPVPGEAELGCYDQVYRHRPWAIRHRDRHLVTGTLFNVTGLPRGNWELAIDEAGAVYILERGRFWQPWAWRYHLIPWNPEEWSAKGTLAWLQDFQRRLACVVRERLRQATERIATARQVLRRLAGEA